MPQFIRGDRTVVSTAEFDYQGLRGTPYCVIYRNDIEKKSRIYLLDTREKLYYPLAEWDADDREASRKWYEHLIAINDGIREKRVRLEEEEGFWVELDKIEQIVPDEDKMIQDLKDDTWSRIRS